MDPLIVKCSGVRVGSYKGEASTIVDASLDERVRATPVPLGPLPQSGVLRRDGPTPTVRGGVRYPTPPVSLVPIGISSGITSLTALDYDVLESSLGITMFQFYVAAQAGDLADLVGHQLQVTAV